MDSSVFRYIIYAAIAIIISIRVRKVVPCLIWKGGFSLIILRTFSLRNSIFSKSLFFSIIHTYNLSFIIIIIPNSTSEIITANFPIPTDSSQDYSMLLAFG